MNGVAWPHRERSKTKQTAAINATDLSGDYSDKGSVTPGDPTTLGDAAE